MIYKAIGVTSGGNPASITISFTAFTVTGKQWQFDIIAVENQLYNEHWQHQLQNVKDLSVEDYIQLHQHFGTYIGQLINNFIEQHALQHQVQLIACNGHNIINLPSKKICVQLGDGASIATITGLAVITDIGAMYLATGGEMANLYAKANLLMLAQLNSIVESTTAQIPEQYKEAVMIALLGVLRWREEATVLQPVNHAKKGCIGGAIWLGSEA